MPLQSYGVLRGSAIDRRPASGQNAHFQVHVVDDTAHYRLAVNVDSADPSGPSEVRYVVVADFSHVLLDELAALPRGWHALPSRPGGMALDLIRANLFDERAMRVLPFDLPGPDNDLNEQIEHYVGRAIGDEHASVFAFGDRWGPEPGRPDKIFGFEPGGGVHEMHMNQSNVGRWIRDDGVWQDGGLLLHFPAPEQWVGIFIAFQSQRWHTDPVTGHALPEDGAPGPVPTPSDRAVRIVGALVNAVESPEHEFATLLNTTAAELSLEGWRLVDRDGNRQQLHGSVAAGETLRVALAPPVVLPNRGGILTLLDAAGLKVDGVAYTGEQASEPGRTLAF